MCDGFDQDNFDMFEHSITLNEFNRAYLANLLADVPDDQLDAQPAPGLHSVRWILAHLAIVVDYGFKQLDLPFICPKAWHVAYGPASQSGTDDRVVPSREELLAAINDGYAKLCVALKDATPEKSGDLHEVELLKSTPLKTKGQLVSHILATHFATHLGQLSTLRRLLGYSPLF